MNKFPYIIRPDIDEQVTICISRSRLRTLMAGGYLVASDFRCISDCGKCVVRELLMECAADDMGN